MRCDVAAARNGITLTRALQLKVCLAFSVLFYRIRLVQGWKLVKFGRYFVQFVIWVGIPSSLPFDTDVVPKSRKSIWRWDGETGVLRTAGRGYVSVINQYNLLLAKGRRRSADGRVTASLAGSNGSLPPGLRLTG